jgi:hypothetical protein
VNVEVQPDTLPDGLEVWHVGEGQLALLAVPHRPAELLGQHAGLLPEFPRLLVGERIAARDAERWVATGQNFADAAGNANLDLPGLMVRVLGRRGKTHEPAAARLEAREWRGPTLRLLFHLLCEPTLVERPIRHLAGWTDVAPGTVVRMFEELEAAGCLLRPTPRTRRFVPTQELRDRWIGDFVRRLRPRLLLGRFAPTAPDWYHDFDPVAHGAVWGGEVAAAALGADLRPGVRTLYVTENLVDVLKAAGLRGDPKGNVEVRRRFWAAGLEEPAKDLAPKLLVTADLIGTRDPRCLDAARWLTRLGDAKEAMGGRPD